MTDNTYTNIDYLINVLKKQIGEQAIEIYRLKYNLKQADIREEELIEKLKHLKERVNYWVDDSGENLANTVIAQVELEKERQRTKNFKRAWWDLREKLFELQKDAEEKDTKEILATNQPITVRDLVEHCNRTLEEYGNIEVVLVEQEEGLPFFNVIEDECSVPNNVQYVATIGFVI